MIESTKLSEIVHKIILDSGRFTDVSQITDDTNLVSEGYLDSLLLMSLILEIESVFKCRIPASEISRQKFYSMSSINTMIKSLTAMDEERSAGN